VAVPVFAGHERRASGSADRASNLDARLSRLSRHGQRIAKSLARPLPSAQTPPDLAFDFRYGVVGTDELARMAWRRLLLRRSQARFERHLRRARKRHAARRATLLEELEHGLGARVQPEGANAGVHLAAWLPELDRERFQAFLAGVRRRGVGMVSLAPCYTSPPNREGVLLGYASLGEAEIREGVRRIAEAYHEAEKSP
jgi:GntR family transcriptional regulator/MocR family aminotransferase